jgi:hypothetical protein
VAVPISRTSSHPLEGPRKRAAVARPAAGPHADLGPRQGRSTLSASRCVVPQPAAGLSCRRDATARAPFRARRPRVLARGLGDAAQVKGGARHEKLGRARRSQSRDVCLIQKLHELASPARTNTACRHGQHPPPGSRQRAHAARQPQVRRCALEQRGSRTALGRHVAAAPTPPPFPLVLSLCAAPCSRPWQTRPTPAPCKLRRAVCVGRDEASFSTQQLAAQQSLTPLGCAPREVLLLAPDDPPPQPPVRTQQRAPVREWKLEASTRGTVHAHAPADQE